MKTWSSQLKHAHGCKPSALPLSYPNIPLSYTVISFRHILPRFVIVVGDSCADVWDSEGASQWDPEEILPGYRADRWPSAGHHIWYHHGKIIGWQVMDNSHNLIEWEDSPAYDPRPEDNSELWCQRKEQLPLAFVTFPDCWNWDFFCLLTDIWHYSSHAYDGVCRKLLDGDYTAADSWIVCVCAILLLSISSWHQEDRE